MQTRNFICSNNEITSGVAILAWNTDYMYDDQLGMSIDETFWTLEEFCLGQKSYFYIF